MLSQCALLHAGTDSVCVHEPGVPSEAHSRTLHKQAVLLEYCLNSQHVRSICGPSMCDICVALANRMTVSLTCLRRVTLRDMPLGVSILSQTARLGTTSGNFS